MCNVATTRIYGHFRSVCRYLPVPRRNYVNNLLVIIIKLARYYFILRTAMVSAVNL